MNIDEKIINYLSTKYNKLKKINDTIYRSSSYTLRFYNDKEQRDNGDKNINQLMLGLCQYDYKPVDKLSFESKKTYVSIYKTIKDV